MEKWELLPVGFSLRLPLSSPASVVRGVSLFILAQSIDCVLIDKGVCLIAFWSQMELPGNWTRTGTAQGRVGERLRSEEEAREGVNYRGFSLSLWTT